jgi:predicted amidohydrolase
VAAVESRIAEKAKDEHDVAGAIVTPGMIDLHTHVYWGGTSIGVEAEPIARRSGTTTFVDAGTAGPANFPGFRRHVIEPSPVRYPRLSQRFVRGHLRVQPHRDGRRIVGLAASWTSTNACAWRGES